MLNIEGGLLELDASDPFPQSWGIIGQLRTRTPRWKTLPWSASFLPVNKFVSFCFPMDMDERPEEVTSRRIFEKKGEKKISDPRFTLSTDRFHALRHFENYSFIYEKEKEGLDRKRREGNEDESAESRREARERYMKRISSEKKKIESERELAAVRGKKPYFVCGRKRKIAEMMEEAKAKGVEEVKNKLLKKQKERENRSKRLLR
jgi:hypothetical protein